MQLTGADILVKTLISIKNLSYSHVNILTSVNKKFSSSVNFVTNINIFISRGLKTKEYNLYYECSRKYKI